MSTDVRTTSLVEVGSSSRELIGGAVVGAAVLTVVVGFLSAAMVVPATSSLLGLEVSTLIGALLVASGLGLLAAGIGSVQGTIEADPTYTPGIPTAVTYGFVWAIAAGIVSLVVFDFGALWPLATLSVAVAVGIGTVLTREDLGVTVPASAFLLASGGSVLLGVLTPGVQWQPPGLSATVTGTVSIPVVAIVGGLLAVWSGARAYGGFGARGRQNGAHALIGANAIAMISLLVVIVAFIAVKGFGPLTEGIKYGFYPGFYHWFHFHVPIVDTYVIVRGPEIWFYWPFVMEPFHQLGSLQSGVLPAIVGTFWLVLGAVVFAVPLGIGAAVFLTEYAEQGRFTQLVEVSTNGLWSTPSIVYGLFGLAFLVPRIGNGRSIVAGQLVLGFMLLPLVVITSREALQSVPDEYRDASAALGVSKWQTIRSVVVPAAMPGVITGVILGVGRIAGETAPILLVTSSDPFEDTVPDVLGSFELTMAPPFVTNEALMEASSALPYQLYGLISAGLGDNLDFAWGTALVLLIVVLGFYAIGIASRVYFRRKLNQ
ncbi:ABC-type phosphate transport system, permease component [Halapricum desulfuricans]|uniref:Phosphate transport system permease protein PstA n=1 Tax=Halapricum desulfuricans TaxID=2841257 RepID=A0A897NHY4_9EURY|nr:phosphate ABC transporter permease PstA [Halapricum desulfuricans]QSG11045.1 ABC-type phosphate transport system, permease component [Halapricum desulfuricans]